MNLARILKWMAATTFALAVTACGPQANAQLTANNLQELRNFSSFFNNSSVQLSTTGGDAHPVTGIVTPGEYWINGDHIADPANSEPIFLELGGTGNTYDLSDTTINVDTRKLDGFGRNLGHGSAVRVIRISGSNNMVQGIRLIGQDIALDTDPNAQRYADWSTRYVDMNGDNNMVDGAYVVTRGSRTDSYGLGDAFGKGSSGGIQPFIAHRKASAFRVGEATNAVVNNMHLEVYTFGHGFFVQQSTNTTLTNSTVTGELFSSQGVIDHPLYQQYGHAYHQNPIPLKMISGAEGGVRMYTGSSGLTVDNVVVTNMRTGFSTSLGGGTKTLNNVEAYGTESAFGVGNDTTITNAKADGVNGPIIGIDRNIRRSSSIEVELVGDQPFNHDYALVYVNGNEIDVTVTSDRPAEDFENTTLFRTAQFYYDSWRETNGTTEFDVEDYDHINSVLINDTNTLLVLGELAEGNVGRSQGGVIGNGQENFYDGITYVLSGSWLEVIHDQGLGNSGLETGAEFDGGGISFNGVATEETFDANGTVVQSMATLELQPGVRVADEKLTISGDGIDGIGALYSDGSPDTGTRFGSSNNDDESTIFLDGDASIGVGVAGSQFLVGRIQGVGDLTKSGAGSLVIGKSSTYVGDLIVAAGSVVARPGVVHNNLTVAAEASISGIGGNSFNTTGDVQLDGTLDLNNRTDDNNLSGKLGAISGDGLLTSSNASGAMLELAGDDSEGVFTGDIDGLVSLLKTGAGFQTLAGDLNHTGTTAINEGGLMIDGTHIGGGAYTVVGGLLGGSGTINSDVTVSDGGSTAPGGVLENVVGTLTVGGNFSQDSQSLLVLDLDSASSSDQLAVLGVATLSGVLDLSSTDLSDFGIGDTMTLVSAVEGLNGKFDSVDGVLFGDVDGLSSALAVQYDAQSVTARVSILGDTNFDNQVDVLTDAFRLIANLGTNSGATFADGDFNGDGQVDVLGDAFLLIANLGATF